MPPSNNPADNQNPVVAATDGGAVVNPQTPARKKKKKTTAASNKNKDIYDTGNQAIQGIENVATNGIGALLQAKPLVALLIFSVVIVGIILLFGIVAVVASIISQRAADTALRILPFVEPIILATLFLNVVIAFLLAKNQSMIKQSQDEYQHAEKMVSEGRLIADSLQI